jgi:hypothetical protein
MTNGFWRQRSLNNDDTKPLDDTTTIRQIPSTSQQQEPVSQTKGERNWLDNFISQIGDQLQDISYIEILTTSAKDPARVLRKAGKQDILNELENQPFYNYLILRAIPIIVQYHLTAFMFLKYF